LAVTYNRLFLNFKSNQVNYIAKLKAENEQLKKGIEETIAELIDYQRYYTLPKFEGTENDYAHIKTDVYVKITTIKMYLQHTLNTI
jgi:hypothetical protein